MGAKKNLRKLTQQLPKWLANAPNSRTMTTLAARSRPA
jgi:hypothetical protein